MGKWNKGSPRTIHGVHTDPKVGLGRVTKTPAHGGKLWEKKPIRMANGAKKRLTRGQLVKCGGTNCVNLTLSGEVFVV